MNAADRFFAYATDFEQTYVDDDWARLEPYFHDDAVYEVDGLGTSCTIEGRSAIFTAIRKSLDGFDRRFDERKIAIVDGPRIDGDVVEVDWAVTYTRGAAPPFVLEGRSIARYDGERIAYLADRYTPDMDRRAQAWAAAHAPDLDPSYI